MGIPGKNGNFLLRGCGTFWVWHCKRTNEEETTEEPE